MVSALDHEIPKLNPSGGGKLMTIQHFNRVFLYHLPLSQNNVILVLLNKLKNSADPDQLASSEAN